MSEVDKETIVETYSGIFLYSDSHEWSKVRSAFTDLVHLDYSSLTGQPPSQINSDDIIAAWSAFLPKFTFTLHYLSNHVVSIQGNRATASCYGHAIHQLKDAEGGDFWEVYGIYAFSLEKMDSWSVTSVKYNHKYASGNLNLPAIATRS